MSSYWKRKIYLASSWRNLLFEGVRDRLRGEGHEVYDFRNPPTGDPGFSWREIDPNWNSDSPAVSTEVYKEMLRHPAAQRGFSNDFLGMQWADTGVLLLPSGRSAHIEAGTMIGWGKPVHILRNDEEEPDLMHLLAATISGSLGDLVRELRK